MGILRKLKKVRRFMGAMPKKKPTFEIRKCRECGRRVKFLVIKTFRDEDRFDDGTLKDGMGVTYKKYRVTNHKLHGGKLCRNSNRVFTWQSKLE